ncbi:unnamed protein product [Victoria cruziana]
MHDGMDVSMMDLDASSSTTATGLDMRNEELSSALASRRISLPTQSESILEAHQGVTVVKEDWNSLG